jgi:4'-phosphopantetheinyl transferase
VSGFEASIPRAMLPDQGSCHIWWVKVSELAEDWRLLAEAERRRASAFVADHAKRTFVTSRAAQRRIAANYLGIAAAGLDIVRTCAHCGGDHGRPVIPGAPFDFSVAHTRSWVAMAVVVGGIVGIDIEDSTRSRTDGIASIALTLTETLELALVPEANQSHWLLRAWTRKEAATKLTGHGLAADFSQVDVSADTVSLDRTPEGWPDQMIHLRNLFGLDRHVTAIATTMPVRDVELFRSPECGATARW